MMGARASRCLPVLVVAAHADDECIGASPWLLRGEAAVVVLTDGAPRDARWFGRGHNWSAALYRQVRKRECRRALAEMGVPASRIVQGRIPDQELGRRLQDGLTFLQRAVRRFGPAVVVAPAYEGGHPDHDAASFLVACLRRGGMAPMVREWWEYALYTSRQGRFAVHDLPMGGGRQEGRLRAEEGRRRRRAVAAYRSQAQTLRRLERVRECFRPMPEHDYTQPPLPGPTVYEQWGMPWTAEALCRAFEEFRGAGRDSCGRGSSCGTTAEGRAGSLGAG